MHKIINQSTHICHLVYIGAGVTEKSIMMYDLVYIIAKH